MYVYTTRSPGNLGLLGRASARARVPSHMRLARRRRLHGLGSTITIQNSATGSPVTATVQAVPPPGFPSNIAYSPANANAVNQWFAQTYGPGLHEGMFLLAAGGVPANPPQRYTGGMWVPVDSTGNISAGVLAANSAAAQVSSTASAAATTPSASTSAPMSWLTVDSIGLGFPNWMYGAAVLGVFFIFRMKGKH